MTPGNEATERATSEPVPWKANQTSGRWIVPPPDPDAIERALREAKRHEPPATSEPEYGPVRKVGSAWVSTGPCRSCGVRYESCWAGNDPCCTTCASNDTHAHFWQKVSDG